MSDENGVGQKWINFDLWDEESDSPATGRGGEDGIPVIEINIGYITGSSRKPGNLEYSRPGLTISGGLTFALNELKRKKYFDLFRGGEQGMRVRFKLIVAETFGVEEESIRKVASLWKDSNISVILGPQETCLHEAKFATSLNIPMISYVSDTTGLFKPSFLFPVSSPQVLITLLISSFLLWSRAEGGG